MFLYFFTNKKVRQGKGKVVSALFLNSTPRHEDVLEEWSGGIAPRIL
jgi:hypothetical protein